MASEDEWHAKIIAKARMALNVANFIFLELFSGFLSIFLAALLQFSKKFYRPHYEDYAASHVANLIRNKYNW